MNERIQELVEQSGISLYKKDVLDKHFPELYDSVYCESSVEQLEKFAELIVRKCIGVVEGGRFLHDEAPDARFARECSAAIKRHFGVK